MIMSNINLSLRGKAEQRVNLSPLDFHVRGHLNALVYSFPVENEDTLHQRIFMHVKLLAAAPGCLKQWEIP